MSPADAPVLNSSFFLLPSSFFLSLRHSTFDIRYSIFNILHSPNVTKVTDPALPFHLLCTWKREKSIQSETRFFDFDLGWKRLPGISFMVDSFLWQPFLYSRKQVNIPA